MSLSSIGIIRFFNDSVKDVDCVLKQDAFDFVVQEVTHSKTCGICPIVDYPKFLEAKEKLKTIDVNNSNKECRTNIYKLLKYYPFLTGRTLDGKICLEESDVDVYSFVLQKVMFNTIDAGKWICRRLNLPVCSFRFAGNKDKRAVTFQEVTLKCSFMELYKLALELNEVQDSFRRKDFVEEGYTEEVIEDLNAKAAKEIFSSRQVSISADVQDYTKENEDANKRTGYTEYDALSNQERLRTSIKIFDIRKSSSRKLGDLKGNRFTVTLRGFSDTEVVKNLEKGFLNYFGQQRFGNNLNNHEIGRNILEKDYGSAVDNIMKNSKCHELYAMQRYEDAIGLADSTEKYILRCKMRGMNDKNIILGLQRELRMLYLHSYQSFIFNNTVNERIEKGMSVVKGDLVAVGGEVLTVDDPGKFTMFDLVLRMERLNDRMLKGGYRKMIEKAYDVTVEKHSDYMIVGFSLNSSCYATMALREVIGDSVLNKEKMKV